MEFKDYYVTLGVPKTATEKEIKQAFRKLARKYHPDVNPGDKAAEARFKEVNEAHEVLSDPVKRKKYDELGANWRLYEQTGAPPPGSGWGPWTGGDPNAPFGGRSGTRTMTEEELHEMFGGGDPFSDFFHAFFGGGGGAETPRGGRGPRQRAPRQGRDIEHELTLNLDEAYHGAKRTLSIKHEGHARSVDVRIPAGVGDGARLRVAGEGEHVSGGTPPGDLYLRIRLNRHPVFERRGRDLYTHVHVPLTTAVLGGEVSVDTLGGRSLRLKVPPTTQHGQVFRLKGHGMPVVGKPNESGDLYATVDVDLPKTLSTAERGHYEALRKLEADARAS